MTADEKVLGERLLAGGLDGVEPIRQHRRHRIDTLCRSPSSAALSRRLTRSIASGSSQPWNGAPLRSHHRVKASPLNPCKSTALHRPLRAVVRPQSWG